MTVGRCGCSPQGYRCAVGEQLVQDVVASYQAIESVEFPLLAPVERETIWQQYQQVVEAYLRHCGYLNETGREQARG